MIDALAASKLRRLPALLLIACLLVTGVPVTGAPSPDEAEEGMSARAPNSHAQLVRAPALRPGAQPGAEVVALPAHGPSIPAEWLVRAADDGGSAVEAPRAAPRPHHRSRAPPVHA